MNQRFTVARRTVDCGAGVSAACARPDDLILVNEQRSAWAGFEEAAKLGVKACC